MAKNKSKTESKKSEKNGQEPDQKPGRPPSHVFTIDPELRQDIYEYLETRPMAEVEEIIDKMFELDESEIPEDGPYYTEGGIKMLFDYLTGTCPRKEVKGIIYRLQQGGLNKFKVQKGKGEGKEPTQEKRD